MAAEVQRGGPPGSENDAEEKQRRADAKMAEMQAKNDRMRKRYEEVEADKKNANLLSKMAGLNMKDEPTPGGGGRSLAIEPEFFSRGRGKQLAVQQQYANNKKMGHTTASESTKPGSSAPPPDPKFGFLHDPSRQGPLPPGHIAAQKAPSKMVPNARGDNGSPLQRGLGRGSSRASHQPPTKQEMEATMTGRERKEYEQWRQERENIDRERLDRAKTSQGEWKREWDKEKQEGQLKQPQNRSDESRGSGGIHGNFVPHSHSGGGHHNSPRDLGHDRERGNGGPPPEDNATPTAFERNANRSSQKRTSSRQRRISTENPDSDENWRSSSSPRMPSAIAADANNNNNNNNNQNNNSNKKGSNNYSNNNKSHNNNNPINSASAGSSRADQDPQWRRVATTEQGGLRISIDSAAGQLSNNDARRSGSGFENHDANTDTKVGNQRRSDGGRGFGKAGIQQGGHEFQSSSIKSNHKSTNDGNVNSNRHRNQPHQQHQELETIRFSAKEAQQNIGARGRGKRQGGVSGNDRRGGGSVTSEKGRIRSSAGARESNQGSRRGGEAVDRPNRGEGKNGRMGNDKPVGETRVSKSEHTGNQSNSLHDRRGNKPSRSTKIMRSESKDGKTPAVRENGEIVSTQNKDSKLGDPDQTKMDHPVGLAENINESDEQAELPSIGADDSGEWEDIDEEFADTVEDEIYYEDDENSYFIELADGANSKHLAGDGSDSELIETGNSELVLNQGHNDSDMVPSKLLQELRAASASFGSNSPPDLGIVVPSEQFPDNFLANQESTNEYDRISDDDLGIRKERTESLDAIERDMIETLDQNILAVEACLDGNKSEDELDLIYGISRKELTPADLDKFKNLATPLTPHSDVMSSSIFTNSVDDLDLDLPQSGAALQLETFEIQGGESDLANGNNLENDAGALREDSGAKMFEGPIEYNNTKDIGSDNVLLDKEVKQNDSHDDHNSTEIAKPPEMDDQHIKIDEGNVADVDQTSFKQTDLKEKHQEQSKTVAKSPAGSIVHMVGADIKLTLPAAPSAPSIGAKLPSPITATVENQSTPENVLSVEQNVTIGNVCGSNKQNDNITPENLEQEDSLDVTKRNCQDNPVVRELAENRVEEDAKQCMDNLINEVSN